MYFNEQNNKCYKKLKTSCLIGCHKHSLKNYVCVYLLGKIRNSFAMKEFNRSEILLSHSWLGHVYEQNSIIQVLSPTPLVHDPSTNCKDFAPPLSKKNPSNNIGYWELSRRSFTNHEGIF